jgi:hypothetical protein
LGWNQSGRCRHNRPNPDAFSDSESWDNPNTNAKRDGDTNRADSDSIGVSQRECIGDALLFERDC